MTDNQVFFICASITASSVIIVYGIEWAAKHIGHRIHHSEEEDEAEDGGVRECVSGIARYLIPMFGRVLFRFFFMDKIADFPSGKFGLRVNPFHEFVEIFYMA